MGDLIKSCLEKGDALNTGFLLLEGGAEFGGQMAIPDRRALELAGGPDSLVVIIPTAAAPDNNHHRAGRNGQIWFHNLGARQVEVLPLIDRASANDPALGAKLEKARLIYMLGGFPRYLAETLTGSAAWNAIQSAYKMGAVMGGSSAGAMVLCEYYFDPDSREVLPGLNLLPATCVLPHHNTFGNSWAVHLEEKLPQAALIGIDEQTGILDDEENSQWSVYGRGSVTLYKEGQRSIFQPGEKLTLEGSKSA